MSYIGSKPANKPVVASDLDPTIITGQTALGAAPADTDEFIVSDAGVLKRMDYSHIKASSPGLVKLASTTISSGVSNVNFDSTYVTDTYDNYFITWTGVSVSNAGDEIAITLSTDGGSSFPSHDGMFEWHEIRNTNSSGTQGNYNYLPCGGDADEVVGNGSNSGYYHLFNLRSTAEWKHAVGLSITYNTGNAPYGYDNYGNAETTSAINYIRFYNVNGNTLDAGIITLYGVSK